MGLGGALSKEQEGRECIIAYGSCALNRAERNYCVMQEELLAIWYFVEYYRQYLLRRRLRVRSDHQALVFLFKIPEPCGRVAIWIEILSEYNFFIEYRRGSKQLHADALSRCDHPSDCTCADIDMSEALAQ